MLKHYRRLNTYWFLDRDSFILEAVEPLLKRLNLQAYYVRGWEEGEHIALVVHKSEYDYARSYLVRFCRSHESAALAPSPGLSKSLAYELAQLEAKQPTSSMRTHGQVVGAPWMMQDELNWQSIYPGYREFMNNSSKLALAALGKRQDFDLRLQALKWMLTTVSAFGTLETTTICFHSHIEGFLMALSERDSESLLSHYEKWYTSNEFLLTEVIKAFLEPPEYSKRAVDHTLYTLMQTIALLSDEATPTLPDGQTIINRAIQAGASGVVDRGRGISNFHRLAEKDSEYQTFVSSSHFRRIRLAVNLLYLLLSQIGVTPAQKYFLCYALSRFFGHRS